jgi:predicted O-methyltransferase YrrM
MPDRRSVKVVARSVLGERAWSTLRRVGRRGSQAPRAETGLTIPVIPPSDDPSLIVEDHPKQPGKMARHAFLAALHHKLQPRTYLETGVSKGNSLALSRCRSIGIDPEFAITAEIRCDVALYREGSDEFFARPDPVAHLQGLPIDLAFIDGMHLFEFALRDFMNIERYAAAHSVIVFDDVLPRTQLEAARARKTKDWTGDVFWVIPALTKYRPDLIVIPVDTRPTGTLVVLGANPDNTVLSDQYDEILREFQRPDPQDVPESILTRADAVQPKQLLAHPVWERLVALRATGGPLADQLAEVWTAAADLSR